MSGLSAQPPPSPPPLPPNRTGLLQRIAAPFNLGTRAHGSHSTQSSSASPRDISSSLLRKHLSSQSVVHRTSIPIAALDVNRDRSHAILAGQEILKTVRIHEGKAIEDFNLRSAIHSSPSYGPGPDPVNQRREYLPTKDVRWSHGTRYDSIIATAALNGRIALYDVSRLGGSRIELEWIHQHTGQVNKLDFDPVGGYLLLSGSQDKTVKIWDIRDRKTVFKRHNFHIRHPVRDVKWSPSAVGEFAVCTENGIIQKWDVRNPAQALLSINAHEKACYTIDWHPDGRHLVSGGFDKYVRVWDFKSENRRQKPAFQLRTPQAVMNLRWRPPSWSSELDHTGFWQCTQLVTSYTDDDPRIHVWDLRRPLLPFRELDQHSSRPTDLLWASKDLLWSVGNEGLFTQTDIRYSAQVHDELSPCSAQFTPNGSIMTFTEDIRSRRDLPVEDPSATFLKLPQQKLSGTTDDALSRGASDDELDEELSTNSIKRQHSKQISTRSAKSQGNTPPTSDGFPMVVTLDRSMLGRSDNFNNEQVGTLSHVDGIIEEPFVVDFLASNYARPLSVDERRKEPGQILPHLEESFLRNAEACDYVSLHRMAQSWRLLCAVVIPELQTWADKNRHDRLEQDTKSRLSSDAATKSKKTPPSAHTSTPHPTKDSKVFQRPRKVVGNLFKGVVASEVIRHENESTSNMTTPLAMPLPDSPGSKHDYTNSISLSEIIEPIPPLPPSLINSHSTAAAASNALIHDDDAAAYVSPQTSPTKSRQIRGSTISSPLSVTGGRTSQIGSSHTVEQIQKDDLALNLSPRSLRTQEDRRAAIRDYRAQARPLFTLETPAVPSSYGGEGQQNSADSFPMFSASTDSSSKLRSVTESFNSVDASTRPREGSEDWHHIHGRESFDSTPPSGELGQQDMGPFLYTGYQNRTNSTDQAIDDAPGFSFGDDGKLAVKAATKRNPASSANIWALGDLNPPPKRPEPQTTASSASDGMFHFEEVPHAPQVKLYASNPIRRMMSAQKPVALQRLKDQDLVVNEGHDTLTHEYVYSDFRPIDLTAYEPKLPFAWSALPLICHAIAFDLKEGPACAQFSIHLLMHLHPFFFNQAFRDPLLATGPAPDTVAERLMRPDLSYRIIEGLFAAHLQFLHKLALYGPMAELRKICVEFDYPFVYKPSQMGQQVGAAPVRDTHQLQLSCTKCNSSIAGGMTCSQCHELRASCPICLIHDRPGIPSETKSQQILTGPSQLWTFCQVCGHGAHLSCMEEWLQVAGVEGECPAIGCGCDCGPGKQRDRRLARQASEAANSEIIRGPRGSTTVPKKDPFRATPSPAVDKTRDTLRYADLRERGSRSREDTGRSTSHGRGGKHNSDSFGSRRVRVVDPREGASGSGLATTD